MYLSRLILNPRSRQVRNELADPYELHRTVLRAFPDANYKENESAGVLFRVDLHPRTRVPTLLVQSLYAPNWDFLSDEEKDYLLGEAYLPLDVENPAVKAWNPQLREGQELMFRLRANPTKREKASAKRIGLIHEDDQRKWLERKLQEAGATLLAVNIVNEQIQRSRWLGKSDGRMSFLAVRFEGMLRVQDPDKLREHLTTGFGSAKGFGFGLLSLARA